VEDFERAEIDGQQLDAEIRIIVLLAVAAGVIGFRRRLGLLEGD
jgi:hypothetical protein